MGGRMQGMVAQFKESSSYVKCSPRYEAFSVEDEGEEEEEEEEEDGEEEEEVAPGCLEGG